MQLLSEATTDGQAIDCAGCARAILDGLPAVMWFVRRHMRRHRTAGLSVPQFRALCLLDLSPTASLSSVAEHLGSSQPTASRLINGLVTRAFVTRKTCPDDRRQVALVLTPRGRSVLAAARAGTIDAIAREIGGLPPQRQRNLIRSMQTLQSIFAPESKR